MGIELPTELADVAAKAGVRWPKADEDAMRQSAQAWRQAGTRMASLATQADGTAHHALGAVHGSTGDAARQHWNRFVAPDSGHLTRTVAGCNAAADRLEHAADQIGAAKVQIVSHLVNLAKTDDAAQQAAAAGHPTALLGLDTAVRGTAANVANVQHNLTQSVRLDSGQTMQGGHDPVSTGGGPTGHGGVVSGLTSTATSTVTETTAGVTAGAGHTLTSTAGTLVGAQPGGAGASGAPGHPGLLTGPATGPVQVLGHGGQQVLNATGLTGQQPGGQPGGDPGLGGSGLGPGLGGPGGGDPGLIGVGPGGPQLAGHPIIGGPGGGGVVDPGAHTGPIALGPVAGAGPGAGVGPVNDPGGLPHTGAPTPPMGTTVQSSAGAVAPPAMSGDPAVPADFGPVAPPGAGGASAFGGAAGLPEGGVAPGGIAEALGGAVPGPAAAPPMSGATGGGVAAGPWSPSGGGPAGGSPGSTGGSPTGSATGAAGLAGGTRAGRGTDFVGQVNAAARTGTDTRRPGRPNIPVRPPAPGGPPNQTGERTPAPSGELALFLVYLFPIGHLPVASSRPTRQLPPPPEETDYAAGLRFAPHDHPSANLVDDLPVLAAIEAGEHRPVATGEARPADDPLVGQLTAEYDPLGGGNDRDWDRRFLVRPAEPAEGQAAEYAWPPSELCPEGGCADGEPVVLAEGALLDRFGTPEGRVFGADGTPFRRRALPPDHLDAGYRRYRVLRELPVWQATSAGWFDQPGGGLRYRATHPAADLVALGYLAELPDAELPDAELPDVTDEAADDVMTPGETE